MRLNNVLCTILLRSACDSPLRWLYSPPLGCDPVRLLAWQCRDSPLAVVFSVFTMLTLNLNYLRRQETSRRTSQASERNVKWVTSLDLLFGWHKEAGELRVYTRHSQWHNHWQILLCVALITVVSHADSVLAIQVALSAASSERGFVTLVTLPLQVCLVSQVWPSGVLNSSLDTC